MKVLAILAIFVCQVTLSLLTNNSEASRYIGFAGAALIATIIWGRRVLPWTK